MKARVNRIECVVKTADGANGLFSVLPGSTAGAVRGVQSVEWDRQPTAGVVEVAVVAIGESGWTGQLLVLNAAQWRALRTTKLIGAFYAALLWGESAIAVVREAMESANWQQRGEAFARALAAAATIPPRRAMKWAAARL